MEQIEQRAAALERIATVRTEAKIPALVDLLRRAHVPVIVLKGPVTRQRLYAPGADRPTADVDLLVPPRSFRRAGSVLAETGFRRIGRSGHSDVFERADVQVDLHLTLPCIGAPPRRVFPALAAHTIAMAVAGRPVPVLDEPAHTVHLALHAAQGRFDPDRRATHEWRAGWARLDHAQRTTAHELAARLGAAHVWRLARQASGHPSEARSLGAQVPARKLVPSALGVRAFVRSPIPVRVRYRALSAQVQHQLSDEALRSWRERHGLAPLAPGTMASRRAKLSRLATAGSSSFWGEHP